MIQHTTQLIDDAIDLIEETKILDGNPDEGTERLMLMDDLEVADDDQIGEGYDRSTAEAKYEAAVQAVTYIVNYADADQIRDPWQNDRESFDDETNFLHRIACVEFRYRFKMTDEEIARIHAAIFS